MNKNPFLRLSIAFLIALLMHVAPSTADAADEPAKFTVIQHLHFGMIDPGLNGGKVYLSDTGVVTYDGSITYLGGASNAQVLINSCPGVEAHSIKIYKQDLVGPGPDISLSDVTCTSPGEDTAGGGCKNFFGTAGPDILLIGGEIDVNASPGQTPGFYTIPIAIEGKLDPAGVCP